jgi:UDP-N-acetylglucosamine--N-acetylmuramyl-(pentapeptide) pyrophosphoryl-undecaprenol N-acetylglucosamine transferase
LIVFAGGGTGGHLYPAIALMHALKERAPGTRCTFLVTHRAIDRRVLDSIDAELVPQALIPLSARPWRWPGAIRAFQRARRECRRRFERERPAVVIGSGGISSVPGVLEACRAGVPTALLNPDAVPGRANRYLGSRAEIVFAQFDDTADWFRRPNQVCITGCPVRPAFLNASREAGLSRFALDPRKKTLLITGASQGARSVNETVVLLLPELARFEDWQILHLTGDADFDSIVRAYERSSVARKVQAYTEDMAGALAAADLVVSRAGASTLAEITATGRASILMPYPHHKDQHQLANARCLVRSAAARVVMDRIEARQNVLALRNALCELMGDDSGRDAMASAALRIGRRGAASHIADIILARFLSPAGRTAGRTIETVKASM